MILRDAQVKEPNKIVRERERDNRGSGDEARFVSRSSSYKREYICVEEVLTTKVQRPHMPHLVPREIPTKELPLLH
jgi:hypothetical protein